MTSTKLFFIFLISIFIQDECHPAKIEIMEIPQQDGYQMIFVSGEITEGDGDKFQRLVSNINRATVILDSNGGSVMDALQIGATLNQANWATLVLPQKSCFSSCALIWVSSTKRYMSRSSIIGFHAAYIMKNGIPYETGMGNAEIGSYLTHLGLRIEAIRFITQAPPEKLNIITPNIARALGIEIYEQEGSNLATPLQKPTADGYARKVATLMGTKAICNGLIDYNQDSLDKIARDSAEAGHALVGGREFGYLLESHIQNVKNDSERLGAVQWCQASSETLKSFGYTINLHPDTLQPPPANHSALNIINLSEDSIIQGNWGSNISAIFNLKDCDLAQYRALGYKFGMYVTIPEQRLKTSEQAWYISNGRAVTVHGCWYPIDQSHGQAIMNRKQDNKTWEQIMDFNDGKWRKLITPQSALQ